MNTAAECPACARWTIFAREVRRPRRCVHCLALLDEKPEEPRERARVAPLNSPLAVA